MERWLVETFIFRDERSVKGGQLLLDVLGSEDSPLGVVIMRQHLDTPRCNHNKAAFVTADFSNRPLEPIDLSLEDFHNSLQDDFCLFVTAVENLLAKINSRA